MIESYRTFKLNLTHPIIYSVSILALPPILCASVCNCCSAKLNVCSLGLPRIAEYSRGRPVTFSCRASRHNRNDPLPYLSGETKEMKRLYKMLPVIFTQFNTARNHLRWESMSSFSPEVILLNMHFQQQAWNAKLWVLSCNKARTCISKYWALRSNISQITWGKRSKSTIVLM